MKPSVFLLVGVTASLATLSCALDPRLRLHSSKQYSSASCTASEESDIVDYINEYDVSDCDTRECTSECSDALWELYLHLPDCTASDGTNYNEAAANAWVACGTTLASSSSSAESSGTSSDQCTSSQESTVNSAISNYYTGACDQDECSSDCLTDLNNLWYALPVCTSSDGVNYFAVVDSWIRNCPTTTTPSTTSPTTTTPGTNSGSNSVVTPISPSVSPSSGSECVHVTGSLAAMAFAVGAVLW